MGPSMVTHSASGLRAPPHEDDSRSEFRCCVSKSPMLRKSELGYPLFEVSRSSDSSEAGDSSLFNALLVIGFMPAYVTRRPLGAEPNRSPKRLMSDVVFVQARLLYKAMLSSSRVIVGILSAISWLIEPFS